MKEEWLAIESLNEAPFPPQTHGIYINLQLFLADVNFFHLFDFFKEEPCFYCLGFSEEQRRWFCSLCCIFAGERPWMSTE